MKKLDDETYKALGMPLPEPVKWPKDMFISPRDARTIACGLLPDGVDVDKLTPKARQEIRAAIDAILDATHDPDMPNLQLCSFQYLADELRRRGATVMPAPHGGNHESEYNGGDTPPV